MKRRFKHTAINILLRLLGTLVVFTWISTVAHIVTL